MIIQAALLFAFLTSLAEFIILAKISPRRRLRLLGSGLRTNLMHLGFLMLNMFIHWGTLIGTMAAVTAAIMSIVVVALCKFIWGYIKDDRWYYPGQIRYPYEEIA